MSTIKVPEEYLSFDYGFSGVDDPNDMIKTAPPPPASNETLDAILLKLNDLTARMAPADENELREKIRQLEMIIVPLLNNLLKTADKPYVYWPDRAETVRAQLQKVLSITRG